MASKNETLPAAQVTVRTVAGGESTLDLLARVGDWGVHDAITGEQDDNTAHYCGGAGHGEPGGWSVTHVPSGKALVHHIKTEGAALDLAREAHQICPRGSSISTSQCRAALRALALRYSKPRGGNHNGNEGLQ